jgi:4-hydroxy-2-oxoheptanedioate aldolase
LGVAIPHVKTADDARAAVNAARYYPEGRRGCDMGTRASAFGLKESTQDYFARANREILVAIWLEDKEALDNIDEILAVPGIDAVNVGGGDLSLSMGYTDFGHPEVQAAVRKLQSKVRAAGIAQISGAGDVEGMRRSAAEGAFLLAPHLAGLWGRYTRNLIEDVRRP